MKHAKQVGLMKDLLEMIDSGGAPDAGAIVKNPTSSYVCPDIARKEQEALFRNHPQVLGLSGDLPEPDSYFTNNDISIPILATRDQSGEFHAFVNACRHRGAVLADDERGNRKRFVCPFHGWTYDTEGRLMGGRKLDHFGGIDKACNGLIELPSAEKYGLLVVHPQVNGAVDIDELLGKQLGAELESWDLGAAVYGGGDAHDMALNWKIAADTFGENHHFPTLHKTKLSNLFHGDAAEYEFYGRNARLSFAQRSIDEMRKLPEEQWNLTDSGIAIYSIFPNTLILLVNKAVSIFRIYPNSKDAGRSFTRMSHYSAPHIGSSDENQSVKRPDAESLYANDGAGFEFSLETLIEASNSTVRDEDYYIGEKCQKAAESGKMEFFVFGRNEPILQHFHNSIREVIGMPPLEVVNED